MKTLTQHIQEKLRISKDWVPDPNPEFYDKFGEIFDKDSVAGWYEESNINNIIPKFMKEMWKSHVQEFFGDDKVYARNIFGRHKKENIQLYYHIKNFINDHNDFEFIYKNAIKFDYTSYHIYLFETIDLKVALWGYAFIDSAHKGNIIFQKKK